MALLSRADLKELLSLESTNGLTQFIKYGFVGGVSAVADIGTLYVLTSVFHWFYLLSVIPAFIFGTIVNYVLSIKLVFKRSDRARLEITLFTLIGVGGLGLNELVIWIGTSGLHLFYLLSKLLAVAIVFLWSFALRKLLFDKLNRTLAPETVTDTDTSNTTL